MKANRGMTLIELMVVVAIIGILAAVAYPSYEAYVIRANRSAAQQLMLKIASREEQYRLDAKSYTATLGGSSGLNIVEQGWDCTSNTAQCTNGHYTVTVGLVAGPPPGYTITAVGSTRQKNGPGGDGADLTLTDQGLKSPAAKWTK